MLTAGLLVAGKRRQFAGDLLGVVPGAGTTSPTGGSG